MIGSFMFSSNHLSISPAKKTEFSRKALKFDISDTPFYLGLPEVKTLINILEAMVKVEEENNDN